MVYYVYYIQFEIDLKTKAGTASKSGYANIRNVSPSHSSGRPSQTQLLIYARREPRKVV